ncbi:hypothetical protein JAAARDRAFT_138214 [Jaapia argillacea MUCL 33604]|uniref:CENP-V/GFA domain-containing protein n=1 Tax=Jaapia argillacea MUCL 33604 TaxID=933084 RepID=A0A067PQR2_9AGAM|nr:hypothetical protein JAAARDRAFT_138214 [Jaapia argillacea MUCL 33604]
MSSKTTVKDTTIRHGSCLCGKVQYELTGSPFRFTICHCENCHKATGSAFMTNAFFRADQVRFVSDSNEIRAYSDSATLSGSTLNRSFCGTCGSPIMLSNAKYPNLAIMPAGCIDDGYDWVPTREIFCDDKWAWLPSIEGTKRLAKM